MLPEIALGVLLAGDTLESQACRTVKQGLLDNAIDCPLFAHEVRGARPDLRRARRSA